MFKTFIIGVLLGVAATAGMLYAIPVVDQHREASIITVVPNGGNSELFHINIPADRVMAGAADSATQFPVALEWPADDILAGVSAEIFKLRNAQDTVIGVAARTVGRNGESEIIDWVVHIPARGSLYVNMEPMPREGGLRLGQLRAGSREFETLSGTVSERWVADTSGEVDAPLGRIVLATRLIGLAEPVE